MGHTFTLRRRNLLMEKKMQKVQEQERRLCPRSTRRLVEEIEMLLEMERFNAWRFKL
jgi:hypothetical protein